jgi:hypothetical protein
VTMRLLFWTCLGGVLLGLAYCLALGITHR